MNYQEQKVDTISGARVVSEYPTSYRDELERNCHALLYPLAILCLFAWLPYVYLDMKLYPSISSLLFLRLGLTILGGATLIISRLSYLKIRKYQLILINLSYMELSTALILVEVAGDPVYMGGFCILILILPVFPLRKFHSLSILLGSVGIYSLFDLLFKASHESWYEKYGIMNLVISLFISVAAIFLLDKIRRKNYETGRLLAVRNVELQQSTLEITQINEQLEKSAIRLSRINEELRKANEIKSNLLGIAAHDLKNPLQVIIGYTQLLKMKMKEDPTISEKLNMIKKSSDKMLQLITALMQTAVVEKGELKLNKDRLDLNQLADTVVRNNRPMAKEKGQEIFLELCEEDCWVEADQLLLEQVIDNLLNNAIKFSPLGKPITVSVQKKIKLIYLRVKDEGPGLTIEDRRKVFGRFQRLSAKPTGGETSTGLGLSIIRDLVELHNGKVHVESELGKGCTFCVEIPRASAP